MCFYLSFKLKINNKNGDFIYNDILIFDIKLNHSFLFHSYLNKKFLNKKYCSLVDSLLNVIAVQRPHWYSLQLLNESSSVALEEYLSDYEKNFDSSNNKPNEAKMNIKSSDIDIDLSQLDISSFKRRTCICSDEIMMKHFNLANP